MQQVLGQHASKLTVYATEDSSFASAVCVTDAHGDKPCQVHADELSQVHADELTVRGEHDVKTWMQRECTIIVL
jgi:hypothetical protein